MLPSLYHSTFVPQSLHSVTSPACLHAVTIFTTLAPTVYHCTVCVHVFCLHIFFKIVPCSAPAIFLFTLHLSTNPPYPITVLLFSPYCHTLKFLSIFFSHGYIFHLSIVMSLCPCFGICLSSYLNCASSHLFLFLFLLTIPLKGQ
jgi:hypothetical protein